MSSKKYRASKKSPTKHLIVKSQLKASPVLNVVYAKLPFPMPNPVSATSTFVMPMKLPPQLPSDKSTKSLDSPAQYAIKAFGGKFPSTNTWPTKTTSNYLPKRRTKAKSGENQLRVRNAENSSATNSRPQTTTIASTRRTKQLNVKNARKCSPRRSYFIVI